MKYRKIFVTGGLGFVGLQVCTDLLDRGAEVVCFDNRDPLTTNPVNLSMLSAHENFRFIKGDVRSSDALVGAMNGCDAVLHLAAISSVDRSIRNPIEVINVNVLGTLNVMEEARKEGITRIHYVSTDEIFGHAVSESFTEESPAHPRNPYAAGKLGAEAIVLAWGNTYKMHVTISNSVNNYGPYQAPEKLIPRLVVRGLRGKTLPVYGTGNQVREWIHVRDHSDAMLFVLEHGVEGNRYCVGTSVTCENILIINKILDVLNLDASSIEYVEDRKGHDVRYALDSTKINDLGWTSKHEFGEALGETINWYVKNESWWSYFLEIYPDLV